jgi:16S rRNA (uracil1498-N3)-methyltransferase
MSDRFYSATPIATERVMLDGPEAHHLLHVMRAAVGAAITLFDGSGAEFDAVVETVRRSEATVRIIERRNADRELPFPLVLGVALPKGDRQKWLVEKLTELGVTALVPLVTARGVAQPTDNARERLERAGIEAAKQCGRNRLMRIAEPQAWSDWINGDVWSVATISEPPVECRRLVAHPGGAALGETSVGEALPTALAIGPEGGLSDEEAAAANAAGWCQVSLGPRILRVETAAIALAAAFALR